MMGTQEPPELPPIVAMRVRIFRERDTAIFFPERQHFLLDELGVFTGHIVRIPKAALAALRVAAAVTDGNGDHHGNFFLRDQIIQSREQ